MRSPTRLASLGSFAFLAFALGSLGGCYDPQLGDNPYLCSTDENVPECPQDYVCMGGICVLEKPPVKGDAGSDSALPTGPDPTNCPDKDVEPNETKEKGTLLGFGKSINWAICTSEDKDYFKLRLAKSTQIKVLLKFKQPTPTTGNLYVIFFGGTVTAEADATKPFPDPEGLLLVGKADTMMAEDNFYLKVSKHPMMNGGANFYEMQITAAK